MKLKKKLKDRYTTLRVFEVWVSNCKSDDNNSRV
jgi:hypothetical protein